MYLADWLLADAEGVFRENAQIPAMFTFKLCTVTHKRDNMAEYSPYLACFYHHYAEGTSVTAHSHMGDS